jgi:ribosomal protein L40E
LDVWVDKSGGGNGTMVISGVPMLGESDLKKKLSQKGIELVSFNFNKILGVYEAKIKWSDFNKSFGTRKVNEDGTVSLDFGKVELGSITAHVDGTIVREKTKGTIKDDKTVTFTSGRARLVYIPSKIDILPLVLMGGGALFILIVVIVLIRRSNKKEEPAELAQTVDIKPDTQKAETEVSSTINTEKQVSSAKICSNCGAGLAPAHSFCTKCGTKVNQN